MSPKIYTGFNGSSISLAPGASFPVHWELNNYLRRNILLSFYWDYIINDGVNRVVPSEQNEDIYIRLYINTANNLGLNNSYVLQDNWGSAPISNNLNRALYYLHPGEFFPELEFDNSLRFSFVINNYNPVTVYTLGLSVIAKVVEDEN